MDLTTITVAQFKAQFFRDFPYLPQYDPTAIYNEGDVTFNTGLFWLCTQDGTTGVTPAQGANWNKTSDSIDNYVLDQDITNAFAEAQLVFNQGLFGTDAQITLGYLYLTAHYMVNDLRTAAQGVQSTGQFPVSGRGAGSVNESYAIPQSYLDDPVLSFYTNTGYGMKYLSMVLPNIRGNVVSVAGYTKP